MRDLISRQAAIDALWSLDVELRPSAIDAILNRLNGLPSAQPEPLTLRVNHELTKEEYDKLMHDIKDAPIVLLPSAQPEIIRCKDCKHFEYDHIENVNGIPLIVAHEICMRWGEGAKTSENGYCFLAERKDNG